MRIDTARLSSAVVPFGGRPGCNRTRPLKAPNSSDIAVLTTCVDTVFVTPPTIV
jgi:hypothetical protein